MPACHHPCRNLTLQIVAVVATIFAAGFVRPARADGEFFAGKTITIVVGYGPGTGYDMYARLFARHLPKHLAGRPSVVTQNMPGAGGFTAAGHLFNAAARDGTVLGVIDQASPLSQTLGSPGFRADVTKFNWIGRFTSNAAVLFARTSARITDMRQAWDRELIISAPGQNSRIVSSVMKNLLGLKLRVLTGYHSSAESQLALERGEIEAMSLPWTVLRGEKPKWISERFVTLLLQMGVESHPDLSAVPVITALARNEEERSILATVSNDSRVGRSILAPPGILQARVDELRKAFDATLADSEFIEDAERSGLDLLPMSGVALQAMIDASVRVSPEVIQKLKAVIEKSN